jgi:hypothetical protein
MECEFRLSVSPVLTVRGVVNAKEYRKLPAEMSSHTEAWVIDSPLAGAGHEVHEGKVAWAALEPEAAAAQARTLRVVSADGAVVPAEPGSAVCSFIYVLVGAVNVVPDKIFRNLLRKFTACPPTAMIPPSHLADEYQQL